MKKLVMVILILSLGLFMFSCGGGKASTVPGSDIVAPDWYLNPPEDPNFLMAVSTATSQDMQLAIDKAKNQARADIAQQLEVKMKGLEKNFREEVGTGEETQLLSQFTSVTKSVVSNVLRGVKVKQQQIKKEGNVFRAYVLMEMPIGAASEDLLNKIKKQQEMYTRFRATQAFKELEDEVDKYEKFKESQGY